MARNLKPETYRGKKIKFKRLDAKESPTGFPGVIETIGRRVNPTGRVYRYKSDAVKRAKDFIDKSFKYRL